MEDDDEFGDLYTDVLRPLQQQLQSKQASPARPIDLNIQSDDEDILYGAPNSNPKFNLSTAHRSQTLPSKSEEAAADPAVAGISDPRPNLDVVSEQGGPEVEKEKGLAEGSSNWASDSLNPSGSRVLESGGDVELVRRGFEDPNLVDESKIGALVEKRDDKDDDTLVKKGEVLVDKKEYFDKFDAEEEEVGTEIGDMGSEPVIPGLSIPGVADVVDDRGAGNFVVGNEASGEGTDWDSDSEDDLQIVLNDNDHGPMAMDGAGVMGSDDEDEDGDPLVIVTDNEPGHQPMEDQDWGEDAAQAADGEKKELGDAAKVNAGVAVAPKIGYSNHAYHPYHSQFKYIRPGAAPMPGAPPVGPGGAPGQVRPPVGMGPVAGRGRGDWRPMQKSFHQFGMPGWGNNSSGRGFGSGLEFTLPSHKTIFEVDVDSFEEKPWRLPGVDVSDFFNFGFNEESWKDYCKQLEQLRLETTMQSRIRVYESGRTEQEYDPDLPPELAAAAGIHDISSENANPGKMDAEQSEVVKGAARVRPPLPTGRPIQVETSYAERLPSIDTRPPRIRDSDAIIEIILQNSADDDSFQGNDVTDQPENEPSRDDSRGGPEIGRDIAEEDTEHFNGFSRANNDRKREVVGIATQTNYAQGDYTEGVGTLPSPLKASIKHSPNSRGQTSAYPSRDVGSFHEERQTKEKVRDRSSDMARVESTVNKNFPDEQREDLIDSTCGKPSPRLASPVTAGSAGEPDVERDDSLRDEMVLADGRSVMDREERALDLSPAMDTCIDENAFPSVKKQKLSSRVEHSSLQDTDGGDFKAARSSENSKARSGSSRDHQKLRDSVDEEVVQRGHSTRMGDLKRDEQSVRRKGRDERHEMEKRRLSEKGREDAYSRRDRDPHSIHQSHGKIEGVDRRKEREGSEVAWLRQDDDQHGRRSRAEDTRKREYGDEIGSRHRSKVRESERSDKDERLHLRKQMDNGSSRSHHEKDVGSRLRERDDNLKSRYDNMDDLRGKRRKEEEHLRRDAEKEEILHGHRENTNRRKRERDDSLDLRKRDDQVRIRDDDFHSVRHKEEGWIHRERSERPRERDEWHRIKQSHEESLLKRDREEGRTGVRGGRAAEEKALISHGRVKDKGSDRDTQLKDTGRQNEQHKRRDWVEDLSQHRGREDVHARGSQLSNDERRSRQDRAARSDRTILGSDKHKAVDKKNKDVSRRVKESDGGDQNSMGQSKRNQEDRSGQMNEPVTLKGRAERGNGGQEILLNRQSSRHKEDASSDDEQDGSKRGRSKLERWTSHKERDFSIGTKSSSTLNFKEISKYNNGGSSSASKLPDESSKTVETIHNQQASCEQKDAGDTDNKNVEVKPLEDKHLETVAKLKKRSERFKLPMPIGKDAMVIKKMESEPLPSAQNEARADSEIKQERPARKRRWVNN